MRPLQINFFKLKFLGKVVDNRLNTRYHAPVLKGNQERRERG